MLQHFLIALRSGVRSRSFQAILVLGILAMAGTYLAAQFSGRQPATVAMDVGFSFIRIIGLLLALFWGYELLGKEIERRTLFVSLTYPLPRSSFVVGRFLGLAVLLVLALIMLGLMLAATVWAAGHGYLQATPISLGWAFWVNMLFVWLDLAVIAGFGFLVSAFATSAFLPLGVGLAFAVAARSLGPALDFLLGETNKSIHDSLLPVLQNLRWIMPDLSRLDIRYFPMYGQVPEPSLLFSGVVMALSYTGVLLALAILFFNRRQMG